MMTLPLIDLVFAIILVVFALLACIKGFIRELFDKGAPIIGLWCGILFYRQIADSLMVHVGVRFVCNAVGFLLVFVLTFIIVKILQQILENIFSGKIFRQLDHTMGFLFGLLEGIAVISIILLVLRYQPWFDVRQMLEASFFYKFLGKIIFSLHNASVTAVPGAA